MSDKSPMYLRKMTAPEITEAVKTVKIAILVIGSIEEHGSHLPIDTDLTTADYLALEALNAARLAASHPLALIAPSIPYGGPGLGMTWPGTLQMKPSTLIEVVCDIGGGLITSGFEYVLIINGCAGNISTLMLATSQLKERHPDASFILTGSTWETPGAIKEVRESKIGGIGHACEIETSIALVVDPQYVQLDKAKKEKYHHPSQYVSLDFESRAPFYWPISFNEATESGVIGDPTLANEEKGKFVLDANIKRLSDLLCHINNLASPTS